MTQEQRCGTSPDQMPPQMRTGPLLLSPTPSKRGDALECLTSLITVVFWSEVTWADNEPNGLLELINEA